MAGDAWRAACRQACILLPGEAGIATSSRMTEPPAADVMALLTAILDASPGYG